ncbi:MAG: 3-isopropylmalate dehydratase large subunit, partial [Candidatus Helarchaeota archaeon]|nr:3-isopropylmalate dehydratase large subunit [Candidatus Helarchaeota archaeon]
MPTIAEKIFASHSGNEKVEPGQIINANVDIIMVHDMLGMRVVDTFKQIGINKVKNPDRIVALLDHWVPPNTIDSAIINKTSREFIKKYGIKNYLGMDKGICHQIVPENGFVWPGALIVGTDSHTCTYGAFGAFSTGIGSTDCAVLFAEEKLWFKVPETILYKINGKIPKMVFGKDIILRLITDIGVDGATYKSVEFTGNTINELSIDGRMTICNMGVEMGAKAAIIPPDQKTIDWLKNRVRHDYT